MIEAEGEASSSSASRRQSTVPPSSRRPRDRAPITLRVDYKRKNTFFADYAKNISKGGTFIRTPKALEVGTEFRFILALPSEPELALKGIVRWSVTESEATEQRPAGMGIEFVFTDDAERRAICEAVAQMMHDSLGTILTNKLLGLPG